MSMLSIGKVFQLLGISLSTAYRWIKSGKLKEKYKTIGSHRRFCEAEIRTLFFSDKAEGEKIRVAVYARVSSHDQKEDLIRLKDRLLRFGSKLIFKLCRFHGIKIVMIEDDVIE